MKGADVAADLDGIISLLSEVIESEAGRYVEIHGQSALSARDMAKDPEIQKLLAIRDRLVALRRGIRAEL